MKPWPLATVAIVSYQSRAHLDRCLPTVLAQRYPGQFEVVIVDNASPDGAAEHVRNTFPTVRLVDAGDNLGFARANNLAADHARGDVIAFLNPDTEVAVDWLAELVRPLLADPTIGLTTSRVLLLDDRSIVNACGNEISLCGITWCRGAGMPADEFSADSDVDAVSGCAFAARTSQFRSIGGLDPSFFMYLEDTDLSWRMRKAGLRCRLAAASIAYHDYSLALTPRKIGWLERNRYRMLGKHLSWRSLVALAPALLLGEAITWGYAALRGPQATRAKAEATLWAAWAVVPRVRLRPDSAEGDVARAHLDAPTGLAEVGGHMGAAAEALLTPAFQAAGVFARATLPRENRRNPRLVNTRRLAPDVMP